MTIKYTKHYLNQLIGMKTPERGEKDGSTYSAVRVTYAEVRNLARDLLKSPNKEKEKRLDDLLLKITNSEEKVLK